MAKGKKNKNQNKNVDVVQEVNKEEDKAKGEDNTTQADTVKQTGENEQQGQDGDTKGEEEAKVPVEEAKTQETLVGGGDVAKEQEPVLGENAGTANGKQGEEEKKADVTVENKEESKVEKGDETITQNQATEETKKQTQQPQLASSPVEQPKPTEQQHQPQPVTHTEPQHQQPEPVQPEPPKQQPKPVLVEQPVKLDPTEVKEQTTQLSYRHELEDGLKLVGQAFNQTVYQNPLAHEQEAHGVPEFTEKFDPATFHLIERMMQASNIKTPERGTPEKRTPQKRTPEKPKTPPHDPKLDEAFQEIKQSAESIDPDPLELDYGQDSKIVNILKSLHSDSDDEEKKKVKEREREVEKEKERVQEEVKSRKSSNASSRKAIVQPPENPSYTNPLPIPISVPSVSTLSEVPVPPVPPPANPTQNEIVSQKAFEQSKKELDFDQINKEMLKQREIEWQKMQERELEPRRPAPVLIQPENPVDTSSPIKPHVPEKLRYTNNMPIIVQERNEQIKQKIRKQSTEIKGKLEESEKLKKDVESSDPIKKFGVSVVVGAALLGACVLGKADKKIAAGASIAGVILSYLFQK